MVATNDDSPTRAAATSPIDCPVASVVSPAMRGAPAAGGGVARPRNDVSRGPRSSVRIAVGEPLIAASARQRSSVHWSDQASAAIVWSMSTRTGSI